VFKVYYDTPNGRPAKWFDTRAEAIAWAEKNTRKCPVVVHVVETIIWEGQS
jgi:hypothetical protein